MRVLICVAIALILCACCHTKTITPCPEVAFRQVQVDAVDTVRQRVSDAWTEAENEEIVSAIEKSDSLRWMRDVARGFVLVKTYDADIHMYMFFRITIARNGMLFLEGGKRNISAEHMVRLILFYNKVIFTGKGS